MSKTDDLKKSLSGKTTQVELLKLLVEVTIDVLAEAQSIRADIEKIRNDGLDTFSVPSLGPVIAKKED